MSHKFAAHRLFFVALGTIDPFLSLSVKRSAFSLKKNSGACFIVENRPKHERKDVTFDE